MNNQQIHFNIYDIFYSQCSQQHVSAGILAIFKVKLLQEYKHNTRNVTLNMAGMPAETCC